MNERALLYLLAKEATIRKLSAWKPGSAAAIGGLQGLAQGGVRGAFRGLQEGEGVGGKLLNMLTYGARGGLGGGVGGALGGYGGARLGRHINPELVDAEAMLGRLHNLPAVREGRMTSSHMKMEERLSNEIAQANGGLRGRAGELAPLVGAQLGTEAGLGMALPHKAPPISPQALAAGTVTPAMLAALFANRQAESSAA